MAHTTDRMAALFTLLSGTGRWSLRMEFRPSSGRPFRRRSRSISRRTGASSSPRTTGRALAAVELALTFERITRNRPAILQSDERTGPVILLSHGPGGDGFRWRATAIRLRLPATAPGAPVRDVRLPRSAWLPLGGAGAARRAPSSGTSLALERNFSRQAPSFKGRCLIIGHAAFMADADGWIVWAARNRLNTIFLHVTADALAFGAAPEKQWAGNVKPHLN